MPIARYGDACRHAAMFALDGAVQASKAWPENVPGWIVGLALAVIFASALASVSVESSTTATPNTARTTRLRCTGANVRTKTSSRAGQGTSDPTKDQREWV